MDWEKHFLESTMTADEAVKLIHDNQYVIYGHAAAAPNEINKALTQRAKDLDFKNLHIFHMLYVGDPLHLAPEMESHIKAELSFVCDRSRKAVQGFHASYIPCHFSDVPWMFKNDKYPVDIAVVQATPPNDEGFCSLGISCDYGKSAIEKAKVVILEINDRMPWVGPQENLIHVSEVDAFVPCSYKIFEPGQAPIGEIEKTIAAYCASLIPDGATLQMGIGAIPDAVLSLLKDRKDLGIHTEMFTDGVIDLVEAGVITGKRKTLHPGKIVGTFLMGSQRLYDFVDRNPMIELYPVDYVNNPYVIGQNNDMITINSCIEVDLTGQVASETIGSKHFSGSGGQMDYVRGAHLSKGGKSIITMRSTAAGGKFSRIVGSLKPGAVVTSLRNDMDYIITEYGIAYLRGKTMEQRAKALIDIAHPDFREMLCEDYFKLFGRTLKD